MQSKQIILGICRLTASVIMLQTLYFKFSAHPDSVYIFSTLKAEPYGRILAGISELVSAILILIPRTTIIGAALGAGIMAGAILSHIFVLGIDILGDGGKLFSLAILTFIACQMILFLQKNKIRQTILKLWN